MNGQPFYIECAKNALHSWKECGRAAKTFGKFFFHWLWIAIKGTHIALYAWLNRL